MGWSVWIILGDENALSSDDGEIGDVMVGDHRKKENERKIIKSTKRRRDSSEVIGSSGKIVDSPPQHVNPHLKKRRRRVLVLSSRSITPR